VARLCRDRNGQVHGKHYGGLERTDHPTAKEILIVRGDPIAALSRIGLQMRMMLGERMPE
jgi:hypothetical protein